MVATGQEMFRENIFFKVREDSGNSTPSQGKLKSLKEIRKSEILRVHFTDMNRVVLVEYFS